MKQAVAYAAAIADNATDDGVPLPMDLVDSFAADYERIITSLVTAATVK